MPTLPRDHQRSLAAAIRRIGVREVSRRSGVNVATVSRFTNNLAGMSHDSMRRICKVCGYKMTQMSLKKKGLDKA